MLELGILEGRDLVFAGTGGREGGGVSCDGGSRSIYGLGSLFVGGKQIVLVVYPILCVVTLCSAESGECFIGRFPRFLLCSTTVGVFYEE